MENHSKHNKNYVSIDTILYKIGIQIDNINYTNCIEWIYDALGFINIEENTDIFFETRKVINYKCYFPQGLKNIKCLFKYNNSNYEDFTCKRIITTINDFNKNEIYKNNFDLINDYSIIGNVEKFISLPFEKGIVGFLFQGIAIDEETNYPLILDNQNLISALEYYIKFKMSESDFLNYRKGSTEKLKYFEERWKEYVRFAKNNIKINDIYKDPKILIERNNDIIFNAKN